MQQIQLEACGKGTSSSGLPLKNNLVYLWRAPVKEILIEASSRRNVYWTNNGPKYQTYAIFNWNKTDIYLFPPTRFTRPQLHTW